MTKTTLIETLTEDRCNEYRLQLATQIQGDLKVTRLAPLEDDDVDLLIEFEGTPTNAQAGLEQALQLRKLIETALRITLDFVEMVPRRSIRNGVYDFHTVIAWFKLK